MLGVFSGTTISTESPSSNETAPAQLTEEETSCSTFTVGDLNSVRLAFLFDEPRLAGSTIDSKFINARSNFAFSVFNFRLVSFNFCTSGNTSSAS